MALLLRAWLPLDGYAAAIYDVTEVVEVKLIIAVSLSLSTQHLNSFNTNQFSGFVVDLSG
jgi:hypothetical protein